MMAMARVLGAFLLVAPWPPAGAHDTITTNITFNREIVRIVQARCARCHRERGTAFALTSYAEARPWAVAIKEEILARRMPPWGAVKGFGEFRNDEGLSAEEVELLLAWVDGGVPEGEERDLPERPVIPPNPPAPAKPVATVTEKGYVVARAMKLDGVLPLAMPEGASMQVVARLPDGAVEPLVWLDAYQPRFQHAFLFAEPVALPAGTRIDGVAAGARLGLLGAR